MVLIDIDDAAVGDVGRDYFLRVFEVQHLQQQQTIYCLLAHRLFSSQTDLLDLVGVLRMHLLLLFLPRTWDVHRVEQHLPHRKRFLVDRRELVVHNRAVKLYYSIGGRGKGVVR